MPFVRLVIVALFVATCVGVPAVEPTNGVTVYALIAEPFPDGTLQLTVAAALPLDAATLLGASGVVAGVTALDVPTGLEPAEFIALTVKVYVVPFVRPVIVTLVTPPVTVKAEKAVLPTYDVTV